MTKALTFDQYEKWVKEYLDFLRQREEESGEEMVMMVGGFAGSASIYAPSESNDHLRIQGGIGFHSDAFEENPGADLLMPVMGTESWRRRLLGSVPFERSVLSGEIKESIEEQQAELERHYPDFAASDSGEEAADD